MVAAAAAETAATAAAEFSFLKLLGIQHPQRSRADIGLAPVFQTTGRWHCLAGRFGLQVSQAIV